VLLYQMLSGRRPFASRAAGARKQQHLFRLITTAEVDYKGQPFAANPSAVALLKMMLVREPVRRIPAGGVLASPWLETVALASAKLHAGIADSLCELREGREACKLEHLAAAAKKAATAELPTVARRVTMRDREGSIWE
jgi:hypothetical protein